MYWRETQRKGAETLRANRTEERGEIPGKGAKSQKFPWLLMVLKKLSNTSQKMN